MDKGMKIAKKILQVIAFLGICTLLEKIGIGSTSINFFVIVTMFIIFFFALNAYARYEIKRIEKKLNLIQTIKNKKKQKEILTIKEEELIKSYKKDKEYLQELKSTGTFQLEERLLFMTLTIILIAMVMSLLFGPLPSESFTILCVGGWIFESFENED